MDAIILEGRKSTRMHPLTATTPKHLLELQGRPLLEWSLLSLRGLVDSVLIIANDMSDQVEAYMAQQLIIPQYRLVAQEPEPLGEGHALQCCQPYLTQPKFLVIKGDNLYDRLSLEKLAAQPLGILGAMHDYPNRAGQGVLKTDESGKLTNIHESPMLNPPPQVQVNAGAYKLDTRIFDYPIRPAQRGEYEIADYVLCLTYNDNDVRVVEAQFWLPIGKPDHLMQAESLDLDTWIPH
jgi:glucose-1-phosphate thymidylyltransferase